jgi:hypothetical protein
MHWKAYGSKRSWLNLRYDYGIYLKELKKTTKISVRTVGVPDEIETESSRMQVRSVSA